MPLTIAEEAKNITLSLKIGTEEVPVNPSTTASQVSYGSGTVQSALSAIESALSGSAKTTVVDDIAARDLLEAIEGDIAFVKDATADETVESGSATYVFDGSAWTKISEMESMDLVINWNDINGKPTSEVAAIDNAVTTVSTLASVVGNAESGLVKDVADAQSEISDLQDDVDVIATEIGDPSNGGATASGIYALIDTAQEAADAAQTTATAAQNAADTAQEAADAAQTTATAAQNAADTAQEAADGAAEVAAQLDCVAIAGDGGVSDNLREGGLIIRYTV